MSHRTFVYVDGFNLYYRALKHTGFKWLNLKALAETLLISENKIESIKYYTARVSGAANSGSPRRQQIYLSALRTIPEVQIFQGSFLANTIRRPLANPGPGDPKVVEVRDSKEKGSDVKLAVHMVNDAWKDAFDVAIVISNDTDLCEPIRIVREERRKKVGLICPAASAASALVKESTFVRHLRPEHLAASQFAQTLAGPNGPIIKPSEW